MVAFIMAVVGIVAVIRGKFSVGWRWTVKGRYAQIIGCTLCLPFPVSYGLGILYGQHMVRTFLRLPTTSEIEFVATLIDLFSVIVCLGAAYFVAQYAPAEDVNTTSLLQLGWAASLAETTEAGLISLIEEGVLPARRFNNTYKIKSKVIEIWRNIKRGKDKLEAGDYQLAITYFSRAIDADPRDASTYLLRARAYHRASDRYQADSDFNTAKRLNPVEVYAPNISGYVLSVGTPNEYPEIPPAFTGFRHRAQSRNEQFEYLESTAAQSLDTRRRRCSAGSPGIVPDYHQFVARSGHQPRWPIAYANQHDKPFPLYSSASSRSSHRIDCNRNGDVCTSAKLHPVAVKDTDSTERETTGSEQR